MVLAFLGAYLAEMSLLLRKLEFNYFEFNFFEVMCNFYSEKY